MERVYQVCRVAPPWGLPPARPHRRTGPPTSAQGGRKTASDSRRSHDGPREHLAVVSAAVPLGVVMRRPL